jgi:hypothetical protein
MAAQGVEEDRIDLARRGTDPITLEPDAADVT